MAFQAPYTANDEVVAQAYLDDVMAGRTPHMTVNEGVANRLCNAAFGVPDFADTLLDKQAELNLPDRVYSAARAGLAMYLVKTGHHTDENLAQKYQELVTGKDARYVQNAFIITAQRDRELARAVLQSELPVVNDPQVQKDIKAASTFCLTTREKAMQEQYQELLYNYVELEGKYAELQHQVEALQNKVALLLSGQEKIERGQEMMKSRQDRMEELLNQLALSSSARADNAREVEAARKQLEDIETVTRLQEEVPPLPVMLKQDDRMTLIRNLPKAPKPSRNDYTRRFVLAMQEGLNNWHTNTYVADAAKMLYKELGAAYKRPIEDLINKYTPRALQDKSYGHTVMEQVVREVNQEKGASR